MYLANLYAGAVLLLITGRIGISVLCNFSWALRVGGKALQEHEKKWNIQNYVQDLPQNFCRADNSKLKINIPGTHTVH